MNLFTILLFLSPIPMCIVLIRYLGASSDTIDATFLNSAAIKISGVFAVYLSILGLTFLAVAPKKLGLDTDYAREYWNFELQAPYQTSPSPPIRGTMFLKEVNPNVFDVSGIVGDNNVPLGPDGVGLKSQQYIFLRFKLNDVGVDLVAFGDIGSDVSEADLELASVETKLQTTAHEAPGHMHIVRGWPWRTWGMITLLPLIVVVALSFMGPLVASIGGQLGFLPQWVTSSISNIVVQLSGATAAYLIIVSLVLYTELGALQPAKALDSTANLSCQQIKGKWYFDVLHPYPDERSTMADYTGAFFVDCVDSNKSTRLTGGYSNVMYERKYIYRDKSTCYTSLRPGTGNYTWQSVAAGIANNRLIAIYRSDDEIELGVLFGQLAPYERLKWIFFDFKDHLRPDSEVNQGEMNVFRESILHASDCAAISAERFDIKKTDNPIRKTKK